MARTVLIAGATGGLGRRLVRKLLQEGAHVRVLVHEARPQLPAGVEIYEGDTRRPETLAAAVAGVEAVICATGTRTPVGPNSPEYVDFEGVRNLAAAAKEAGVEHLVLVSSIAVTRPDHPLNAFGKVLSWKLRGEEAVRKSGVPYTIVRPGGLKDEPGGRMGLQFDQGDRMTGMVGRDDIAEVCLQALRHAEARGKTFEVVETTGTAPQNWAEQFRALEADKSEEK